jgi:hypothetical protein
MKAFDYLSPAAVLAAMVHLAVRPTWVSAAVLAVAAALFAAERLVTAFRFRAEMAREHSLVVAKYGTEVQELRAEVKAVVDAVKSAEAKVQMARRSAGF